MTLTMFDSIDLTQIPSNAEAVAGYVNGKWPTYHELGSKFPKAHKLSIAVTADHDAECLDIENGDATNADAPAWVKRQKVTKPVVYTSVSNAEALLKELAAAGIQRDHIRLWTAHYTMKAHICDSKCGFGFMGAADATQYSDKALGRNLDASLVSDGFFPAPPKPAPVPPVTITGPRGHLIARRSVKAAAALVPALLKRFKKISLRRK